jgi:thiol:disulfide interchange protein
MPFFFVWQFYLIDSTNSNRCFMKQIKINTLATLSGAFLTCLFLSSSGRAQQQSTGSAGIVFSNQEFEKVLATAKASHKKIFVDAYATWCSPCKQLQKTTFRDANAAAYFNRNFINISMDVEKGEGIALAKKWQIDGLPTLLILDEKGKMIAGHTGYVDGAGLLEFAKEAAGK